MGTVTPMTQLTPIPRVAPITPLSTMGIATTPMITGIPQVANMAQNLYPPNWSQVQPQVTSWGMNILNAQPQAHTIPIPTLMNSYNNQAQLQQLQVQQQQQQALRSLMPKLQPPSPNSRNNNDNTMISQGNMNGDYDKSSIDFGDMDLQDRDSKAMVKRQTDSTDDIMKSFF